ncbi:lipopolysaccharide assembly protein LapA domain-containing protein [Saccharothrix sp. NPDC042600]|uniref:LapA family protein n=1 Tax=Saccharothrix TaxID=2071 RepID=UPI0033CF0385|nr:lipopolysaccharide assembly protein LapA domain-containing protein [Saccharothrix mutabilis subsp. capreolus]
MTTPRDEDRTDAIPTSPITGAPPPVGPTSVDRHPESRLDPDTRRTPEPAPGKPVKIKSTRISGTWVAVLASIVVLIFLLIFILQNGTDATIHFLGIATTLPLGVALLFAAIGGAVMVALVGAARILQLRRQAKRGLTRS